MKENLQIKIKKALNQKYVGEYIFSENERNSIFSYVQNLLKNYESTWGTSISIIYDEILFVAMVNAIKLWDTNKETFFECICENLLGNKDRSQKVYNHLVSVISRLGQNGQIIYIDGKGKHYYSTILAHAFAPRQSINAFFDLCWEVFCEDLAQQYQKEDEMFDIIANSLKNKLSETKGDDDDFKLGSKTYSLRAGITRLAVDVPSEMSHLIERVMALFDKVFNKGEPLINNNYFDLLFSDWWKEKENDLSRIEHPKERRSYERAVVDYNHISPKYVREEGSVYLVIPSIRLKDNFYNNPIITVYNAKEIVYQQEMRTNGSGLTMTANIMKIKILPLCQKAGVIDIEVHIKHCDNIIYQSKNSLKRDFILLRENREVTGKTCEPGNYNLFLTKFDILYSYPQIFYKIGQAIYAFQANEGELLQSPNKHIYFSNKNDNDNLWLNGDFINGIMFLMNDEEYFICSTRNVYINIPQNVPINNIGININGQLYKLTDLTCKMQEDILSYWLQDILNIELPYKIIVFQYSDKKILLSKNIFILPNLKLNFDKNFYYDSAYGNIEIQSKNYYNKIKFEIKDEVIKIKVFNGLMIIDIPLFKWRINDKEWNIKPLTQKVWYEKISNTAVLEINVPMNLDFQVCAGNSYLEKDTDNSTKYKLGDYIYTNFDHKEIIIYAKDREQQWLLLNVVMQEIFEGDPLGIKDGFLYWEPQNYIGKDSRVFNVTVKRNSRKIFDKELDLNSYNHKFDKFIGGIYEFIIEAKTNILTSNVEKILTYTKKIGEIEYEDLIDDRKFVKAVESIILEEEKGMLVMGPFFRICDNEVLKQLTEEEKERYTLCLMNKYSEHKPKIKETMIKNNRI